MIRYRLPHSNTWRCIIVRTESNQNVFNEQKKLEGFNGSTSEISFQGTNSIQQAIPANITEVLLDHPYATSQNPTVEADIKPDLIQVKEPKSKEVKVTDADVMDTDAAVKVIDANVTVTDASVKVIDASVKVTDASVKVTDVNVKVTKVNVKATQTAQNFPTSEEVKVAPCFASTLAEHVKMETNNSSDEKVKVITENVEDNKISQLCNLPTAIDPSMSSLIGTNDTAVDQVKDNPLEVKDTSQVECQSDSVTNDCMAGMNNLIVTVTDPKESSMFIKLDDDLASAIADLPMLNGKLDPEDKERSDGAKIIEKKDGGNKEISDRKKDDDNDEKDDNEKEDDEIGELEEIELTDLRGDSVLGDIIGEIERRPWECGHCGKMFTYKHNLKTHMLLHNTGPKPLQCPDCSRRFLLPHHLRIHRRHAHTGLRPYVCSECGMAFTQSSNLKRHKETHMKNRQKKYRCKVCGKRFFELYHLERHKVSHTSDRPYTCKFCSATFKRKEHLQRHEEIHTKENGNTYPCVHCKRVFSRRQAYEKHCLKCEDSVISSDTSDDDDNDNDNNDDNDEIVIDSDNENS